MVGVAILLTSCNKDLDLDIKYKLTVNIDNMNVVKNIKSYDGTDYFPNGTLDESGCKVRVSTFLYNSTGDLVCENIQLVDDFSKKVTVTESIANGGYTLVSCTDIVVTSGSNVNKENWTFESKASLKNFKIVDQDKFGSYKVLGISKSEITINKSEILDINNEPTGAMIVFLFNNMDYKKISYVDYAWEKKNDYYLVNEDKVSVKTDIGVSEYETESDYTGFFDLMYFLPIKDFIFYFETYDSNVNLLLSKKLTFDIEKNVNKLITINASTGVSSTTNTKSAYIPNSDGQVLRIQSLPTRKINSAE